MTAAPGPSLVPAWEAEAVLGSADVEAAGLAHGGRVGVTRGVSRVTGPHGSAVLKVVGPVPEDPATTQAASYRFWEREPLLYERGLFEPYLDADIRMPQLLARFDRPDGDVALWLEDVHGTPATGWDLERFGVAAGRLGLAQGAAAVMPATEPWLSKNFLPHHLRSWSGVDWSLLTSDVAWDLPLVRDAFPGGLRPEMTRLHAERDRFLSWMAGLPRTLCHLDVWPANLFDTGPDGRTVLVDWAYAGDGALGEDPGNLVPDSVFDLFLPSAMLPELDRTVFDAYLDGLRRAGWKGDERLSRLATCASAVKYEWLTPSMLARAGDERHLAYGRQAPSAELYRERGATLMFLAGWADEARRLAAQLGLD